MLEMVNGLLVHLTLNATKLNQFFFYQKNNKLQELNISSITSSLKIKKRRKTFIYKMK